MLTWLLFAGYWRKLDLLSECQARCWLIGLDVPDVSDQFFVFDVVRAPDILLLLSLSKFVIFLMLLLIQWS
jgi:hypothetical protein